MPARADALHLSLKIAVYVSLYFAAAWLLGRPMYWLGGYVVGITTTGLLAAAISNALCLRIYVHRGMAAIGLQGDKAALTNLAFGCLGGMGAAAVVLAGPLFFHAARIERDPASPASLASFFSFPCSCCSGRRAKSCCFADSDFRSCCRRSEAGQPSCRWA